MGAVTTQTKRSGQSRSGAALGGDDELNDPLAGGLQDALVASAPTLEVRLEPSGDPEERVEAREVGGETTPRVDESGPSGDPSDGGDADTGTDGETDTDTGNNGESDTDDASGPEDTSGATEATDTGDSGGDPSGGGSSSRGSASGGADGAGSDDGPGGDAAGGVAIGGGGSLSASADFQDVETGDEAKGETVDVSVVETAPKGDGDVVLPPVDGGGATPPAPTLDVPSAPALRGGQERRLRRQSGLEYGPDGHHAAITQALGGILADTQQRYAALVAEAEATAMATADWLDGHLDGLRADATAGIASIEGAFALAHNDVDGEADAAAERVRAAAEERRATIKQHGSVGYGRVSARKRKTLGGLSEARASGTAMLRGTKLDTHLKLSGLKKTGWNVVKTREKALLKQFGEKPSGPILKKSNKTEFSASPAVLHEQVRPLIGEIGKEIRKEGVNQVVQTISEGLIGAGDPPSDLASAVAELEAFTEGTEVENGADRASKGVWSNLDRARKNLKREEADALDAIERKRAEVHATLDARCALHVEALGLHIEATRAIGREERAALQAAAEVQASAASATLDSLLQGGHAQVLAAAGAPTFKKVEGLYRFDQAQPALASLASSVAERHAALSAGLASADAKARAASVQRMQGLRDQLRETIDAGAVEPLPFIEALLLRLDELVEQVATRGDALTERIPAALEGITTPHDARGRSLAKSAMEKAIELRDAHVTYVDQQIGFAEPDLGVFADYLEQMVSDASDGAEKKVSSNLFKRADKAFESMKGAGTYEYMLWEALDGLTPTQGWAFEGYYDRKKGYSLLEWLEGDLNDEEMSAAVAYLSGDSIEGRMRAMIAADHWSGTDTQVIKEAQQRFRSPEELQMLLDKDGYDELQKRMLGSLNGVDLAAFKEMDSGNLAGMFSEYLKDDLKKARKDQDLDALADAFKILPKEMHGEIVDSLAGKIRADQGDAADPDASSAQVVTDFITDDYQTTQTYHGGQGVSHTVNVQNKGWQSKGDDAAVNIVGAYVEHGAGSVEVDAAWVNKAVEDQQKLGIFYNSEQAQKHIGEGRSPDDEPGAYEEKLRNELKQKYGLDSDEVVQRLQRGDLDAKALAGLIASGQVEPYVAIELLLRKDAGENQNQLADLLANIPADELDKILLDHPELRDEILKSRKGRKRQEMEWALRGAPRNDREFYDLIVDMYTYARGNFDNGVGATYSGQDLDKVYKRLHDLCIAGRDPSACFDADGVFIGDPTQRAQFRTVAASCKVSYKVYQQAKEDQANLWATIVGALVGIALAPFTAGASLAIIAAVAAATATAVVITKAAILGQNYTLSEAADDFVETAAESIITAGIMKGGGKVFKSMAESNSVVVKNMLTKVNNVKTGAVTQLTKTGLSQGASTKGVEFAVNFIAETGAKTMGAPFVSMLQHGVKEHELQFEMVEPILESLRELPNDLGTSLISKAGSSLANRKLKIPPSDKKAFEKLEATMGAITSGGKDFANLTTAHAPGAYADDPGVYQEPGEQAMLAGLAEAFAEAMAAKNLAAQLEKKHKTRGLEPGDYQGLLEMEPSKRNEIFASMSTDSSEAIQLAYANWQGGGGPTQGA